MNNSIKTGVVSAVNSESYTCDVYFEDQDVTVCNLSIMNRGTRNKDNDLPNIKDLAICLFIPPSNTDGVVLGFIYNEVDNPSGGDINTYSKTFPDGSKIKYSKGEISLIAKTKVLIQAPAISLSGTLDINKNPYDKHKHLSGTLLDGEGRPVTGISGVVSE